MVRSLQSWSFWDFGTDSGAISRMVRHAAVSAGDNSVHCRSWNFFMDYFSQVVLFTDTDGRARFCEKPIALDQGSPQSMLSAVFASGGYQLRTSPVGFHSQFHCTMAPQWCFILRGQMQIGLQDGVSRIFQPGEHFYSADVLPDGATFDSAVHGHWSRQVGNDPLVTLFVRA
jgi:hypothetical protein